MKLPGKLQTLQIAVYILSNGHAISKHSTVYNMCNYYANCNHKIQIHKIKGEHK